MRGKSQHCREKSEINDLFPATNLAFSGYTEEELGATWVRSKEERPILATKCKWNKESGSGLGGNWIQRQIGVKTRVKYIVSAYFSLGYEYIGTFSSARVPSQLI